MKQKADIQKPTFIINKESTKPKFTDLQRKKRLITPSKTNQGRVQENTLPISAIKRGTLVQVPQTLKIRRYCKQLFTNKFDNLDEMENFIEKQNLLKQ